MTSNQRIQAFAALGSSLSLESQALKEIVETAHHHNPWFTPENVEFALKANINLLNTDALSKWIEPYKNDFQKENPKIVGLILAGNIPMVGFHDILTCLLAGFSIQIKPSSDDKVLIPFILKRLIEIEPAFTNKINFVDRLSKFDLIIATGSNNTSRYFEYYFKNVPHIIRKNRNSIAVISGEETKEDLFELGHDLFNYFGLGCRNVSKLFFPEGYNYSNFFEAIEPHSAISNHYKYHNNYEYNKAIYLVNGDKHLDNGFLLLKEDDRIASPLGVAYFEEYNTIQEVGEKLQAEKESIQCIVSKVNINNSAPVVDFGRSQMPGLTDYADGVNILDFLKANMFL